MVVGIIGGMEVGSDVVGSDVVGSAVVESVIVGSVGDSLGSGLVAGGPVGGAGKV